MSTSDSSSPVRDSEIDLKMSALSLAWDGYEEAVKAYIEENQASHETPESMSAAIFELVNRKATTTFPLNSLLVDMTSSALLKRPALSIDDLTAWVVLLDAHRMIAMHFYTLPTDSPVWEEPRTWLALERYMDQAESYVQDVMLTSLDGALRDKAVIRTHSFMLAVMDSVRHVPFVVKDDNARRIRFLTFVARTIPTLLATREYEDQSSIQTSVRVAWDLYRFALAQPEGPDLVAATFSSLFNKPDSHQYAGNIVSAVYVRLDHLHSIVDPAKCDAAGLRVVLAAVTLIYECVEELVAELPSFAQCLLQVKFYTKTCQILVTLSSLLRLAIRDHDTPSSMWFAISAHQTMGKMLLTAPKSFYVVPMMFELGVIHELKECDFFIHSNPAGTHTHNLEFAKFLEPFLDTLKTFLILPTVLGLAVKHLHDSPEREGESQTWKDFAAQIREIKEDWDVFNEDNFIHCDRLTCLSRKSSETPQSIMRCSGCAVSYYCSEACQKLDWKAHKASCKTVKQERLESGGYTTTLNQVELSWFRFRCFQMIQTLPEFEGVPVTLVRHMDFTTYPLTASLKPLKDRVYREPEVQLWVSNSEQPVPDKDRAATRRRAMNPQTAPDLMFYAKFPSQRPMLFFAELLKKGVPVQE